MITPAQLAEANDEHSHQAAFFQWIATVGAKHIPEMRMCFAVPNGGNYGGGKQGRISGARMKAEGLKSGVPDIFWPWPSCGLSGLWLELKHPRHAPMPSPRTVGAVVGGVNADGRVIGGRSPKQIEWHLWLREQKWPVVTAYGWVDAAWVLVLYAKGDLPMPDDGDCLFVWGTGIEPWS